MTQREFIDKLKTALSGKVSTGTLQENISYYEQYFYSELCKGKSEAEICAALGAPQLIAKGILEAEKYQSGSGYDSTYSDEIHEEQTYRTTRTKWKEGVRTFHMPGWLMLVIGMLVFSAVISLAITVFSALAPIIIPVCIVLFIVQLFKSSF